MRMPTTVIFAAALATLGCNAVIADTPLASWEKSCHSPRFDCQAVSGTGIHYFTTALVHDQVPTNTGFIQRSTDIIDLDGDVRGRVLYHPVSEFDFEAGTLVNTGDQVFSGTVLGGEPVMIYDNSFRFDVNLINGATTGRVYLDVPLVGNRTQCYLEVTGAGASPEGDALVTYEGLCRLDAKP